MPFGGGDTSQILQLDTEEGREGEMRERKGRKGMRRIRSPFTFIPSFTEQEKKRKERAKEEIRSFSRRYISIGRGGGEEGEERGVGCSFSSDCECGRG